MQSRNSPQGQTGALRNVLIAAFVVMFVIPLFVAHVTTAGMLYVLPALRGLLLFIGAILLPAVLLVVFSMGCCGFNQLREYRHSHASTHHPRAHHS